jgi:signal transduction histidine kinase
MMQIVLDNLLGNAWKYTSKRDETVIEFGMSESGGATVYFVRDNGIGFAPEEEPTMFRPFQRTAAGDEFKGHGIGLATVRKIIERHGGSVRAEGKPGEGATFYFTLPEAT